VSAQLIMHFRRQGVPHDHFRATSDSRGAVVCKPVLFHDKESRGALAYLALAGEMIPQRGGGAGASGKRCDHCRVGGDNGFRVSRSRRDDTASTNESLTNEPDVTEPDPAAATLPGN